MVEFNIDLFKSNRPSYVLDDRRISLNKLRDDIVVSSEEGLAKVVEKGEEVAAKYNATVAADLGYPTDSKVHHKIEEDGKRGYVALTGYDVLYEEFGTGDVGANNGHPMKGDFPFLNPYNSGQYIKTHEDGTHYWFYSGAKGWNSKYYDFNPDYKKKRGYTEGIPAGKQMYKTSRWLRVEAKKIILKEMQKALKGKNITK